MRKYYFKTTLILSIIVLIGLYSGGSILQGANANVLDRDVTQNQDSTGQNQDQQPYYTHNYADPLHPASPSPQDPYGITKDKTTPEYAPGEIIVKLKSQTDTAEDTDYDTKLAADKTTLADLNQQFGLVNMDGVFTAKPTETYKGSKTIREAIAKKKRKAQLRAKRAPENATTPDLSHIYKLKFSKDADVTQIAAAYNAHPDVEYAEPNYMVEVQMVPNDPYYSSSGSWGQNYDDLWGLKKINAEKAWDISQGEGVVVAVIDSGIDYNHEDIADNVWINEAEIPNNGIDDDGNGFIDDVRGWDFAYDDNDPKDGAGHGTHVAGTIAAVGNNGIGVIGVAPKAKVMAVKGLDNNGNGYASYLANCIRYAANNGADVLNNSWGGPGRSRLIEDAVNYAYSLGCVVVAAAGNDNNDAANYFPANIDNVITVAATWSGIVKASFSNWGSKVDIAAPGTGIFSTVPGGYTACSGTSMAAPHVSGVAALILSYRPDFNNEDIRKIIRRSADKLNYNDDPYAQVSFPYPDYPKPPYNPYIGRGILNAYQALLFNEPPTAQAKITFPSPGKLEVIDLEKTEINITGTAIGDYYILKYGNGRNPLQWSEICNNSGSVTENVLATWDIEDLKPGPYTLSLTVFDSSGYTESRATFGKGGMGWPQVLPEAFFCRSRAPIAIGDINGDGSLEMAAITGRLLGQVGSLYVFDRMGNILPAFDNFKLQSNEVICMANIDNSEDGSEEIVVSGKYGGKYILCAIDKEGNFLWERPHGMAPVIADVEKDGTNEVLYEIPLFPDGNYDGVNIYLINNDGSDYSSAFPIYVKDENQLGHWYHFISKTLVDLDRDGVKEIIVSGSQDGYSYLYAYSSDGEPLGKNWPIKVNDQVISSLVTGDLDRDGLPEIVVATKKPRREIPCYVYVFDSAGVVRENWPVALPYIDMPGEPIAVNLSLANINQEGDVEIIVTYATTVHIFNLDGTEVEGWPQSVFYYREWGTKSFIQGSAVAADIDGDGDIEIAVAHYRGSVAVKGSHVTVWHHTGELYDDFNFMDLTHRGTPIICDFDNDGDVDIIVHSTENAIPGRSKIFIWDLAAKYNEETMEWPMYGHDPQHTGRYTPPAAPQNRSPVFSEPVPKDVKGDENSSVSFSLRAVDEDKDTLEGIVEGLPEGAVVDKMFRQYADKTEFEFKFNWTPSYEQAGEYKVTFTVSDGESEAVKTIPITVNNVNRPPVIVDCPDKVEIKEGEELKIKVTATDPDIKSTGKKKPINPNLEIDISDWKRKWEKCTDIIRRDPPEKVLFISEVASSTNYDDSGRYKIMVSVSDGETTVKKGIVVEIKDVLKNNPPQLFAPNEKTVYVGERVYIRVRAYDRDADDIKLSAENLPKGAMFRQDNWWWLRRYKGRAYGRLYWQPKRGQEGKYKVTFIADDGKEKVSKNTMLIIKPRTGNIPPKLRPIRNRTGYIGRDLSIWIFAYDRDGDDIKLSAENLPKGASFRQFNWWWLRKFTGRAYGMFRWRPRDGQEGSYKVTFTASDGKDKVSQDANITIKDRPSRRYPWWRRRR